MPHGNGADGRSVHVAQQRSAINYLAGRSAKRSPFAGPERGLGSSVDYL